MLCFIWKKNLHRSTNNNHWSSITRRWLLTRRYSRSHRHTDSTEMKQHEPNKLKWHCETESECYVFYVCGLFGMQIHNKIARISGWILWPLSWKWSHLFNFCIIKKAFLFIQTKIKKTHTQKNKKRKIQFNCLLLTCGCEFNTFMLVVCSVIFIASR